MRPTVQGGGSGSVQQGGPVEPRSRARRVRRGGAHRRGHPHPGDVLLWRILGKCASMTSPHPLVWGDVGVRVYRGGSVRSAFLATGVERPRMLARF